MRSFNLRSVGFRASVLLSAVALVAVGAASAQNLPRNETLYITGHQWGPPNSFNPVGPTPAWPTNEGGNFNLIYETLFAFNQITGELEPLLGATLETPDETTFRVTLQEGTAWQDGEPLTSADVVYTFELAQRQPVGYVGLWDYVSSVTADDERTVTFALNPDKLNPGTVRQALNTVTILPQHIWSGLEDEGSLLQVANNEPVGSGPYTLQSANNERVILVRNDDYWGEPIWGAPAPTYLVHPIFSANDAANLAFSQGQLDLSQNFIPEVWNLWEQGQPITTWTREEPYYLPGVIPMLYLNLSEPGLDNPEVRRAIAHAINYPLIAQTAMSRYSEPVNSSLIIPSGSEAELYDAEAVAQNGWTFDPQRAVDILEGELGATTGGDGIYVLPDGTRLGPWELSAPYGWTDWNQALEIVASSAQAVGIDLRTNFPEQSVWQTNIQNGTFELALYSPTGVSAAGPWPRFQFLLDGRNVPPVGQTSFRNFNRYDNPEVSSLLDQAASASPEEQKALYTQLDDIFRQDIPAIPLMYRPFQFYTVSETVWSGFPTEENPYAPPTHNQAGVRALFEISAEGE